MKTSVKVRLEGVLENMGAKTQCESEIGGYIGEHGETQRESLIGEYIREHVGENQCESAIGG